MYMYYESTWGYRVDSCDKSAVSLLWSGVYLVELLQVVKTVKGTVRRRTEVSIDFGWGVIGYAFHLMLTVPVFVHVHKLYVHVGPHHVGFFIACWSELCTQTKLVSKTSIATLQTGAGDHGLLTSKVTRSGWSGQDQTHKACQVIILQGFPQRRFQTGCLSIFMRI